MPTIRIEEQIVQLPTNLALLDTCVLKAFADPGDQRHGDVKVFLEFPYTWVVPGPVIVESCGILTSQCSPREVQFLMQWLGTPGNVTLIPDMYVFNNLTSSIFAAYDWMKRRSVDYVDTYLMRLAHELTTSCNLRPFAPVATFDQRDFLKFATGELKYSLIDAKSGDPVEFDFS